MSEFSASTTPPFRRKPESHSPKANPPLRCRAKRFRLSPEWRYFGFSPAAEFRPRYDSRLPSRPIPAKAGISTPKAQTVSKGVQLPASSRRRRFLLSQEGDGGRKWDGLFPLFSQEWVVGRRRADFGRGAD
ncbi:MAG: hypothetical protein ACR2QC_05360 [Gammaproteobacteria bacterium]